MHFDHHQPRLLLRLVLAIWRGMRALDDHWIGDVVCVICLFALGYVGLVAAYVFGGP